MSNQVSVIDNVKALRVTIDGYSQLTEDLYSSLESFEIESCKMTLLFAKAWLGKILGQLDVPSPYSNDGKRKSTEDIEPTADVSNGCMWPQSSMSHVEKVDFLREEIKSAILIVENIEFESRNRELAIARTNTYNYLCESRFYLGFELQRIRENEGS